MVASSWKVIKLVLTLEVGTIYPCTAQLSKKGLLQLLSFCDSRDGSLKQSAVNIITVIIPSHLLDNPRILDDLLLSPSESHYQGTIYL